MTELSVAPRSWLLSDPEWRYAFGPYEAPVIVAPGTDSDGVQWWLDDPDGWWAPSAVTPMNSRSYGDGGYAGATTYEPRTLSFGASQTCVVAAPDRATALAAYRLLLGQLISRDPVLLTGPDPDGQAALWLRASGAPKIRWLDDRCFEWSAVMVAEDPLKFDAAEWASPVSTGLPQPWGGPVYPWRYPLTYGGGGQSGAVSVTNRGDEYAQATYTVTGPAAYPQVTNVTTGVSFTLTRTLAAGDTVTVDTRSATVMQGGVSVYVDLAGDFPLIAPGTNTIRWQVQGSAYDPAALLTVTTATTRK